MDPTIPQAKDPLSSLPYSPPPGQGFGMIQGLEEYTGCKVLHLEGNCLKRIEGLGHMTQLR